MNVVAAKPLNHTGKAIESTHLRLLCSKPRGGRVLRLAGGSIASVRETERFGVKLVLRKDEKVDRAT